MYDWAEYLPYPAEHLLSLGRNEQVLLMQCEEALTAGRLDYLRDLARWAADSGLVLPEGGPEDFDTMGEPGDRMTTEIDVSPWIERKREAMRAHASQISETSFFLSLSDEAFLAVWGREWYIRVRPPVPAGRTLASSLLPEEPTADRGGGGEAG